MSQPQSAQTVIAAKRQRHWLIPLVVVLLLASLFGLWFYNNDQNQRLQVARATCTMAHPAYSDEWSSCVEDALRLKQAHSAP